MKKSLLLVCLLATVLLPARTLVAQYRPNNVIVLARDQADDSYTHIQKIHTTIEPAERFVRQKGVWQGLDPDWEGESWQVQTHYLAAWSIEVHYDDKAVAAQGRWKHSTSSGNDYAVFDGKHVPPGLSLPVGYATRCEIGCHLSRRFGPDPGSKAIDTYGGFKPERNYQGTGMTVHRFTIPLTALRTESVP